MTFFSDEIVALKRLKMEKEKEGFPITSLREINTILKAQHPNIVTVRVRPMHLCPQGPQCRTLSGHHTWGLPVVSAGIWAWDLTSLGSAGGGRAGWGPDLLDLLLFPRRSSWAATWTRSTSS